MAINKGLITAFYDAAAFLDDIQIMYRQAKKARAKLALYQAGSNPQFNAAINAIIPPADRARIGTMLVQLDALVTEWEATYSDIVNPPTA